MFDFTPLSFIFFLSLLYFAISTLCLIQIFRIIYNRHMVFGWQGLFLMLCFLWALVRGTFFLFYEGIGAKVVAFYFFYEFPIFLQFATFSLLVLFYASTVYKCTAHEWWDRRRHFWLAFYIFINAFNLCLIITVLILSSDDDLLDVEVLGKGWITFATNIIVAALFSLLVVVLGYYGYRLMPLLRDGHTKIPFQPKRSTNKQVMIVTIIIFIIYMSRCVYNIISAFGTPIPLQIEAGTDPSSFGVCVLYIWWELIPAILVIVLFWEIPGRAHLMQVPLTTAVSINSSFADEGLSYQPVQPTRSLTPTIFDNPLRYDSPPETTVFVGTKTTHLLDPQFIPTNSPYSPYNTQSSLG